MGHGLREAWSIAPFAGVLVLAIVALAAPYRDKTLLWFFGPLLFSEAYLISATAVRNDVSDTVNSTIALAYVAITAAVSICIVVRAAADRKPASFLAVLTLVYSFLVAASAVVTDS